VTLDDAVQKFESTFQTVVRLVGFDEPGVHHGRPDGDGRDWSRAPNGEPYSTVTNGGVKSEGERFPAWDSSIEEAVLAWLDHAIAFSVGKGTTLYWRETPQIEEIVRPGTSRRSGGPWGIYSRFAVGT
jgi:hypothetical protein